MWQSIEHFKFKWLVIFIITIFVFTFIYWSLTESFYHSTTWYEPYIRDEYVELRTKLTDDIKGFFFERYNGYEIYLSDDKRWLLNIDSLRINGIDFDHDTAIMKFAIEVIDSEDDLEVNDTPFSLNSFLLFEAQFNKSYLKDGDYYVLYGELIYSDALNAVLSDEELTRVDLSLIFADNTASPYIGLYLTKGTYDYLVEYNRLSIGIPKKDLTNLVRMFYFSTVTITTLGYGDIVPLTTNARILVSLESILGIVFLGLFVNDILNNSRGKRV